MLTLLFLFLTSAFEDSLTYFARLSMYKCSVAIRPPLQTNGTPQSLRECHLVSFSLSRFTNLNTLSRTHLFF